MSARKMKFSVLVVAAIVMVASYALVNYNRGATWVGTKQLGAAGRYTFAHGIAVDANGNVYVAGYTNGGLDGNTTAGTEDLFFAKFDSSGSHVRTTQAGTMRATTVARGVVVDAGGDLYVAGWTGGALDGNTLKGERDSFLMKYDSSGTRVYTEQTGTTETDTAANGVVVDAGGNAYVVGWTSGGLDKDTYPGTHDSFIIKYNPSGAKVYMRQTGTAGKNVFASGVTADARGNVYVTGKTYGGLDGKKLMGKLDAFLMKYDPSGTKVYTEQTGTAGKNTLATGVAVDANGNVYVTGNTNGGLDGNKLIGTTDSFLMKYDPSGAKVFTKQIGTPGIETVANGVAVDAGGMVYVAGNTNGGLDGKILIGTTYAFLMKHDSSGTKVYTRQLGATKKNTYASGVAVDANGNVYVTGYTDGGLDGNSLIGIEDYFVTKYDPAGNKQ